MSSYGTHLGASAILFVQRSNWTREGAASLLDAVCEARGKQIVPEAREGVIRDFHELRRSTTLFLNLLGPDQAHDSRSLRVGPYAASNDPKLDWDPALAFLGLSFLKGDDPPTPRALAHVVNEIFAAAIRSTTPHFALIDHFARSIVPLEGQDLRPHAWGVTIYGPELVQQIGRDRLLSAPAWKVEELSWGGIWVQLAENPFRVSAAARKKVEEHLGLKRVFGGDAAGPAPAAASHTLRRVDGPAFPARGLLLVGVSASTLPEKTLLRLGEILGPPRKADGLGEADRAIPTWLDIVPTATGGAPLGRLLALRICTESGEDPVDDEITAFLGLPLADLDTDDLGTRHIAVTLKEAEAAQSAARTLLAALGCATEPRFHLVHHVGEPE